MSENNSVLLVENHDDEREALMRFLRGKKYAVHAAADTKGALAYLQDHVGVVLCDLRIGHPNGIDLLRTWRQRRPQTPFILMSGLVDVDSAVDAMKFGATDVLTKPVDLDELLQLLRTALETVHRRENLVTFRNPLAHIQGFEKIVGKNARMIEVCKLAQKAAMVDSTVLITGESGTGKELVAQAIHQSSPRRQGPFVTVNMAAVPESLIESELFGHAKGAFTGASQSRIGKYAAADSGTLFVDEIGDLALQSQAKLLRVLENQRVTPVGSNADRKVDVRVVAATNKTLDKMIAQGRFREDLYYRLDVIHLHLPPLRERKDGIPLFIDHFLGEISQSIGRPVPAIEPELMDYLVNYDWPGNVRQLKNCLESMFVLADDDILRMKDLPASALIRPRPSGAEFLSELPLYELERTAIENALREHEGNRTHAAKALRISVRTLQRKLKQFGN